MTAPKTSFPARRATAERNRAKILDAARAAFAEPDADVSMAEISRRAGVGMATLYRNFPGRRELLEAVYEEEVDGLCTAAATLEGSSPGAVFERWLKEFSSFVPSKRLLVSELLEHAGRTPIIGDNRARVVAAGEPLLGAAQQAGEVRDDLTVDQILDMIVAVAKIPGDPSYVEPMLRAVLDGIRPH